MKTAVLKIYSDIGSGKDEFSAPMMSDFIDNNKDAECLEIHIRSCGGEVREGFDIYDLLKNSGKHIKTVCDGMVYSIATVIFLAGDEREALPNSDGFIHFPRFTDPSGTFVAQDLELMAEHLRQEEEKILNLYCEVTGADREKLKEYMKNETMLSADDMVTLGFATKVTEPLKAVAYFNNNNNYLMNEAEKSAFFEKLGSVLDSAVAKMFSRLPATNQVLTDKDGKELKLEKESGDPSIGDMASPDGTFALTNGMVVTVAGGQVTEVATEQVETELDKANAKIAEMEAKLAEMEAVKAEAETAKASFTEKEAQAVALVTELRSLKNTWKPEARSNGTEQVDKNKVDLERVKEIQNKMKEN